MPVTDYTPTVNNVASHLRARTRERGTGTVAGTFNDQTMPTDTEVQDAIGTSVDEIAGIIGTEVPLLEGEDPTALQRSARAVASLLAAMTVESTFYPEQVETGRSNYPALERRYNAAIKRLTASVEAAGGSTAGEDGGGDAGGYKKPSFDFGDAGPGTTMWEPH